MGYRVDEGHVRLGVDLLDVADVVRPGHVIRLRDGAIGVKVVSTTFDSVTCEVRDS